MDTESDTAVALDDYAQQAWSDYQEAARAEQAAKARRAKARDILLDLFRLHDAEIGTIDGEAVCRLVRADREIVDTERLRDEQPYLFKQYRKLSTAYYVREIRRAS